MAFVNYKLKNGVEKVLKEGGSGGGGIVLELNHDDNLGCYTCGYTLEELYDMLNSGMVIYLKYVNENGNTEYRIVTCFGIDMVSAVWLAIGYNKITQYDLRYSTGSYGFVLYESNLKVQSSGGES